MDQLKSEAEKRVGTVLRERWTIDALIGVGGMAAVYRATHRNGNEVAIKILHSDISDNKGIQKRFQREGYAANRVKHRGAVTVFDDDTTEDGAAFLVMELLVGENVEARRERLGGFVPLPEVLGIADQVLDTLAAAHENGIIHRDVKPENLFLTTEGVVKVLDFGIARLESSGSNANLTLTGAMMGTPGFMSPEQARGEQRKADHQSDIWAVGASLFTLLSGQYVHRANTLNETVIYAATKPAPSLATELPDLDPEVVALVDKALSFEKKDRWPDAASMQRELRRIAARVLGRAAQSSMEALELTLCEPLSVPSVPSDPEPPTRILAVPDDVGASEEPPTARALPAVSPVGPLAATARSVVLRARHALEPLPPRSIAILSGAVAFLIIAIVFTVYAAERLSDQLRAGNGASVRDAGPPPVVLEPMLEPIPSVAPLESAPEIADEADADADANAELDLVLNADVDAADDADASDAAPPKPVQRRYYRWKKKTAGKK
jgi:eukaryotic-like serine/threonine-protein kinase